MKYLKYYITPVLSPIIIIGILLFATLRSYKLIGRNFTFIIVFAIVFRL